MSGRPGIVDWLRDRSFGGRDAVAVPGEPVGDIRGPFPAGVRDLIDHLVDCYGGSGDFTSEQWVFLVGAPGNGKSEALRALADALGLDVGGQAVGGRAPRVLTGDVATANVRLVNDASILRLDRPVGGSLHRDVADAFEDVLLGRRTLFFANVNRGVLVEETGFRQDEATALAADCLEWLAVGASGEGGDDPAKGYYARRVFDVRERRVVVHLLSLDAVSLFEPPPGGERTLDFSDGDDPVVAPYEPVGLLGGRTPLRDRSAAGVLVAEVSSVRRWTEEGCGSCPAADLCPFRANAEWLRDPALRTALLETFRAVEVAAGRRVTYRDLTGLLSRCVLGSSAEWGSEHPCDWVARVAEGSRIVGLATLASHRIYASLFPAPDPNGIFWKRRGRGRIAAEDPYGVVLERFGPGSAAGAVGNFENGFRTLDPAASAESWDGIRDCVSEAAEAMHVESPVERLSSIGVLPECASCSLDARLDEGLLDVFETDVGDVTKAWREREPQLRRWRSVLLFRQVGLARGWFCDRVAVEGWLDAQHAVLSGAYPGSLQEGLQRLLVPASGEMRLALYRPRTRSFGTVVPSEEVFVSRRSTDLQAELRAVKDTLQFVLRAGSAATERAAPVPVDLDLAREAMLLSSGRDGFTDLPDQAVARVERVLASLLSRRRLGRSRPVVQVSDADGVLFALRQTGDRLLLMPVTGG